MKHNLLRTMSIFILLAVFVTACSTAAPAPAPTEAPAATSAAPEPTAVAQQPAQAEPVSLRFLTSETDPPCVDAYNKIIAAFEAANPNVKVTLELVNADDIVTVLPAGIATGNPPDVAQIDPDQIVAYAKEGQLLALDDVVDSVGRADFLASSLMDIDGHIYNMPYAGAGTVLWVRTDLFEKAGLAYPTTPEELLNAAEKLTIDENKDGTPEIYGIALPAGTNKWTSEVVEMFMWQNGQTAFDAQLKPTFDTPKTVEAITRYAALTKFAPPGIGSYSFYETMDAFTSGKVAMAPYMGRMISNVAANNPDLLKNMKAIPMPAGTANAANYGGWNNYSVFANSKHPDEAKAFVKFLTTGDSAGLFLRTTPGHLVPPLQSMFASKSLWDEPLMQSQKADVETVFKAATSALHPVNEAGAIGPDGKLTGKITLNPYMNAILNENIFAQVLQKVVMDGQSPADAVKWGQSELERIVAEAG